MQERWEEIGGAWNFFFDFSGIYLGPWGHRAVRCSRRAEACRSLFVYLTCTLPPPTMSTSIHTSYLFSSTLVRPCYSFQYIIKLRKCCAIMAQSFKSLMFQTQPVTNSMPSCALYRSARTKWRHPCLVLGECIRRIRCLIDISACAI